MRNSLPRRRRLGDPLASPRKVKQLLDELARTMGPELSSHMNLERVGSSHYTAIVHLLQAASNFVRSKTGKISGKSSRFPASLLSIVVETMSRILDRETGGRISFRTFADNNLRVLSCSDDVKSLLEKGTITLFEALQLKRLSAENLSVSLERAAALRGEFLSRSRRESWIAHRLRREIDLKLGKRFTTISETDLNANESPSFPYSPQNAIEDSLFAEQLALMMDLLREIDQDNLENNELERLLESVDEVLLQLQKIHRRQKRV